MSFCYLEGAHTHRGMYAHNIRPSKWIQAPKGKGLCTSWLLKISMSWRIMFVRFHSCRSFCSDIWLFWNFPAPMANTFEFQAFLNWTYAQLSMPLYLSGQTNEYCLVICDTNYPSFISLLNNRIHYCCISIEKDESREIFREWSWILRSNPN